MFKVFSEVEVCEKKISKYKSFINKNIYNELLKNGKKAKGLCVMHINSTACGGGVAELLKSQIPLEKDLGIDSHWFIINSHKKDNFFVITKKIHNLLQGKKGKLSSKEKANYLAHNKRALYAVKKEIDRIKPDIIVIHDPQPLSLVEAIPKGIKKVFRLHIDISSSNKSAIDFIKKFAVKFDWLVVSNKKFIPSWFPRKKISIIFPAIDPLSKKNIKLSKSYARKVLSRNGINLNTKIIAQVSRFDPWKDPMGVVRVFKATKKKISDLILILIGSASHDDPESFEIFKKVKKVANGDSNIFLFTKNDSELVNAIQSLSDIIIQKSIREGFGLTATEAMWKERPVIGGRAVGLEAQIKSGKNGFLAFSEEEFGRLVVKLIGDKKLAQRIGKEAEKTVKNRFLTPKMVLDHLRLYNSF